MRRSGLCALCGRVADPAFTCNMCGMIVCMGDYDPKKGLCSMCASKMRGGRGNRLGNNGF